jgi:hypothetical protein
MKKKKEVASNSTDQAAAAPPPVPEKSSALHPDEFPDVAQLAQLAAVLANGALPKDDGSAHSLAFAALRIWRVSRDEINEQRATAACYWETIKGTRNSLTKITQAVRGRLEKLGAVEYLNRNMISWDNAGEVFWKQLPSKARNAKLRSIVSEWLRTRNEAELAREGARDNARGYCVLPRGKLATWPTLEELRAHGFWNMYFQDLVAFMNEREETSVKEAMRSKMKGLAARSVAARREDSELKGLE